MRRLVQKVVTLPTAEGRKLHIPGKGRSWTLFVENADSSIPTEISVEHGRDNSLRASVVLNGIRSSSGSETQLATAEGSVTTAATMAAAAGECTSTRYSQKGYKQVDIFKFYVRTYNASYPTGGVARIQDAAATIIGANNGCGITADTGVTYSYGGTTTRDAYVPNDLATGSCLGDGDGANVLTFGTLTGGAAATCVYAVGGNIVTTDTTFSSDISWWTSTSTTGCSGKRDLLSTATHEIGHSFGLGDLSGSTSDYSTQTMYYVASNCTFHRRSLGSGDVAGLKAIY